jgi:hypothetical protein
MPSPAIPLHQVLVEEYAHQNVQPPIPPGHFERLKSQYEERFEQIEDADDRARHVDSALVGDFYQWLHQHGVERSALCLSGGGIRSATFALGIVQGLARQGLLGGFDYLSTVSGGGYLGGWLSAWIARAGSATVEAELNRGPESPLFTEPAPIRHLRSYSRYLSPRPGFLSADTWTLVATYLRNLLLNWLVLLPLIAATLMFPRLSTALLLLQPQTASARETTLAIALVCGWFAFAFMIASRPSLCAPGGGSLLPRRFRSQGWFLGLCLLPLWISAVLTTLVWAWADVPYRIFGSPPLPRLVVCVLFGAVLAGGGFLLSRLVVRRWAFLEAVVTVGAGVLGGLLVYLASSLWPGPCDVVGVETYICIAAPVFLAMFLIAATIFVGIASRFMGDEDREWMARAGAWILILIVVRSVLSAVVIFGPLALTSLANGEGEALSGLGGVAGLITLLLGAGSKTPAGAKVGEMAAKASGKRGVLLAIAAPVFILVLLAALSLATSVLTKWFLVLPWPAWLTSGLPGWMRWHPGPCNAPPSDLPLAQLAYYTPWSLVLLVAALLLAVGGFMGWVVNINRFSMHALYRDRLIRAYLGASRPEGERRPNPFSGFDPDDNLAMRKLLPNRPLHLLNLTLNLVEGKNLAWQDRKAEPFSVSALHAGSFRVGYRSSAEYAWNKKRREAISLGTAVAVSGAAASPNMGYHSSPVVTFLLALFNMRLGWWLGNPGPAGDRTFNKPAPGFSPGPLFAEAFGNTDDCNPYVYLSDGGHFENLGLYEMVLRRCRYIVVSDAGQDPHLDFEDLGNALSKIRIDLGIPIDFVKIPMRPRQPGDTGYDLRGHAHPVPYCAVGRILYSCVDAPGPGGADATDGYLILIKASLNGTEPVDVYQYAKSHPAFPHEPTENQFYSEAQFESYRALASHAVTAIFRELPPGAGLDKLVEKNLGNPADG